MAVVHTVQGPVDSSDLGTVLVHEHVRFRDEAVAEQWPSMYDTDAEMAAALEAVGAAKERGVATIVDPTAMFGGRDVRFMRAVAEQSGVRIVPCTGIYSYDYLPHYFENRDVDVMADALRGGHRDGHPGDRHPGRVPEVRRRRGRGDRAGREDPPRGGPRVRAGPERRSWPTRCRRCRPAPGRWTSSRRRACRPGPRPDRPLRGHRRRRPTSRD